MSNFRQIIAITALNLRALPQRIGSTMVTVVSVAGVVGVMIALLGTAEGVSRMASRNISPERVLVTSSTATAEYMGEFSAEQIAAVATLPGIRKDANGKPKSAPMAVVVLEAVKKGDGSATDLRIRGIAPENWSMIPAHLVAGRMFHPGLRELVVGKAIHDRFQGFELGNDVRLRGSDWTVVGVVESGGGMEDNTVFADDRALLSALHRNAYQSVLVDLVDSAAFGDFRDALSADPRLTARAVRYKDYVEGQVRPLASVITFLAYFIGSVMAVGATFAAVNALFAAIDARRREIATLRAIGFAAGAILVSIVLEALLLCIPAAGLGALVAYLGFNGQAAAADNLSFSVSITPTVIFVAAAWAMVIGLVGGLAPAIRAARLPVNVALRKM